MKTQGFIPFFFCAVGAFAGCASSRAPSDWLTAPEVLCHEGYGGWLDLRYFKDNFSRSYETQWISGELLAISNDSLYILAETFQALPREGVQFARLAAFDSEAGYAVAGGALFSLTNGWFAVFSLPMWLIGGGIVVRDRLSESFLEFPERSWRALNAYARFPQGLPAGLNRQRLRPRSFFKPRGRTQFPK